MCKDNQGSALNCWGNEEKFGNICSPYNDGMFHFKLEIVIYRC